MKAEIIINKNFTVGEVDKRIYGSFIEHIGRAVYSGIYEPDHPTANAQGFRQDVAQLVKEIDVPIVRYPGGNFVSGYNWEDGIGDKTKRPRKQDAAWRSIEPNEVGIDEFQQWAKEVNTEINMAVNLGTRGPAEAQNLLEYCNGETDTYYANLRRQNGFEEPFNIKTWCLGNEMDGAWQIGGKTAEEYGRTAYETAKLMKMTDHNIELVLCGSSCNSMPTFGQWELTALDLAYDEIDYLSLHKYFSNKENNFANFLGRSVQLDRYIKSCVNFCDAIKAKKKSKKTIFLSLDEWNVWYHSNNVKVEPWQVAPPILEDVYNFEDALLVGCVLMTLQNNCDRVKIACLAQLVNAIAPIMTEKAGPAWRQTIFYPYMLASQNGRGTVLKTVNRCQSYTAYDGIEIPYVETSVIFNEQKQEIVVFAVNRSMDEDMTLQLNFEDFGALKKAEHIQLYHDDIKAINTKNEECVHPVQVAFTPTEGLCHTETLKKHSFNMFRYSI